MRKHYIAIDIGASGGRHVAGWLEDKKLRTREIYRFEHAPKVKDGRQIWDTAAMFEHILEGLTRCKREGILPVSVGIDTWGVDYALLDKNDELIGDVICYRDDRTQTVISQVHSIISEADLFKRTGIATQSFNTLFQLYADKLEGRLERAKSILLVADYFSFLLTGIRSNEYTLASTSGLVNAESRTWDKNIITKLNFPQKLFTRPISVPGTILGQLKDSIQKRIGYNTQVVLPPAHDTASAVLAVPAKDPLYISSGTWSLLGVNEDKPKTDEESRRLGYTNEGGYDGKYRFLKNIMGLWLIQCLRREFNNKYTFESMEKMAMEADPVKVPYIDVNDKRFFNPSSMINAIKSYLAETNQVSFKSDGELFLCVYNSLARAYASTAKEVERLTGKKYDTINIVGGGSKNTLLNQLTAKHSGKKVVVGPVEATAEGNLIAQIRAG